MSAYHGKWGAIYIGIPDTSDVATAVPCVSTTSTSWDISDASAYSNMQITAVYVSDGATEITTGYSYTPAGHITLRNASAVPIIADFKYWTTTEQSVGFYNWSLEYTAEAHDVTQFILSSPWPRSFIPGLTNWTATAERYWQTSDLFTQNGTEAIVRLFWDHPNNKRYEGWGIVTGISATTPVDGVVTQTLNVQGSTGSLGIETA